MSSVAVCTWNAAGDALGSGDLEALTLGRKIAEATGAELRMVAVGGASDAAVAEAGRFGAAAVDTIEDAKLGEMSADVHVAALEQWCDSVAPSLVLMNQGFDVRVMAPRLARRVRAGIVMNGVDLEGSTDAIADMPDFSGDHVRVTTSAFGGDTRTVYALAGADRYIVCLNDNACEPAEASSPATASVNAVSVDLSGVDERIKVLQKPEASGPKLEDATVIVAGGRGLQEAENFRLVEELAAALGGIAGASRPIVDDGWTDSSHQVGLTGKITKPTLYIAAGISGASQHMVGCCAAKNLVAINTDPDAAIFKYARWGIVGNCVEILPELTKAVKG